MPDQPAIKVVDTGKDITSENYAEDYVFYGGKPTISVKDRISLELTTSSAGNLNTNQYFHNFGYIPQLIAFVTTRGGTIDGETYIGVPGSWADGDDIAGADSYEVFDCFADEEYIYVSGLSYTFVPMVGITYRADTYDFDILVLMEEALKP